MLKITFFFGRFLVAALLGMTGALCARAQSTAPAAPAPAGDPIATGFINVPPNARVRMYWRIFGPAWTKPEIDHQLQLLKDAGVGGLMAYFMYAVEVDDPQRGIVNQRFGLPSAPPMGRSGSSTFPR
jgi:hypothetical protein